MRNKNIKRYEFNIHLNEEDRNIINELFNNNVNVSGAFKMFIRQYLEKIKKVNNEPNSKEKQ